MGWGDTTAIHDGGAGLKAASKDVAARAPGFTTAGTKGSAGAGDPALTTAIERFCAAANRLATDLGTQIDTAGSLANVSSEDLSAATGGGH